MGGDAMIVEKRKTMSGKTIELKIPETPDEERELLRQASEGKISDRDSFHHPDFVKRKKSKKA